MSFATLLQKFRRLKTELAAIYTGLTINRASLFYQNLSCSNDINQDWFEITGRHALLPEKSNFKQAGSCVMGGAAASGLGAAAIVIAPPISIPACCILYASTAIFTTLSMAFCLTLGQYPDENPIAAFNSARRALFKLLGHESMGLVMARNFTDLSARERELLYACLVHFEESFEKLPPLQRENERKMHGAFLNFCTAAHEEMDELKALLPAPSEPQAWSFGASYG